MHSCDARGEEEHRDDDGEDGTEDVRDGAVLPAAVELELALGEEEGPDLLGQAVAGGALNALRERREVFSVVAGTRDAGRDGEV